jgi:hypothetical protein
MATSLDGVYGARGSVMYPNRSDALRPRPAEESRQLKASPKLTLGYAGSLSYGYGDRLRELMPDLATLNYVALSIRTMPANPIAGAEHAGDLPRTPGSASARMRRCLAAASNQISNRSIARTFPASLTGMALGTPVLITGPRCDRGEMAAHPDATLTLPGRRHRDSRCARSVVDPAARV